MLELSFGTTKLAAYANKLFVCFIISKIMEATVGLILYIRYLIELIIIVWVYSI